MKKLLLTLTLAALLLTLAACGDKDTDPQDTTASTETASSETVADTTLDTPPDTLPETETETEPETTAPDGFDAVRASSELWLSHGLDAYLAGREAPDLTDFFADPTNMSYLTLYPDMFCYDKEKSVPVAEAFFRFVVDTYGKDALLDTERRIEYKSAYLASLGVTGGYRQDPAVEALLSRMTVSSEKNWKYIFTVDNTSYYLNDFDEGSIGQYHSMFYYNNRALDDLLAYIGEHLPTAELDTDCRFEYYLTFDGTGISFTLLDGRMSINDMHSMLHESLHAMGLRTDREELIWLSEGLCNYLGKIMGFNPQFASATGSILQLAEAGYFDERAEAGEKYAIHSKRIYEAYTAAGGSLASLGEFDLVLYHDVLVTLELELSDDDRVTIAEAYKTFDDREYTAPGTDLTYTEATSFVTYLVKTYGLDRVMQALQREDVVEVLGKTYEELRAAWEAALPQV